MQNVLNQLRWDNQTYWFGVPRDILELVLERIRPICSAVPYRSPDRNVLTELRRGTYLGLLDQAVMRIIGRMTKARPASHLRVRERFLCPTSSGGDYINYSKNGDLLFQDRWSKQFLRLDLPSRTFIPASPAENEKEIKPYIPLPGSHLYVREDGLGNYISLGMEGHKLTLYLFPIHEYDSTRPLREQFRPLFSLSQYIVWFQDPITLESYFMSLNEVYRYRNGLLELIVRPPRQGWEYHAVIDLAGRLILLQRTPRGTEYVVTIYE